MIKGRGPGNQLTYSFCFIDREVEARMFYCGSDGGLGLLFLFKIIKDQNKNPRTILVENPFHSATLHQIHENSPKKLLLV